MDLSEVEDDPEPYESSTDDWAETEKKTTTRRSSRRLTKKPRKSIELSESSDSENEKSKRKPKNGVSKKRKSSPPSKNNISTSTGASKKGKIVHSNNYAVGSFVISKKDAKVGDPNKHPWIWRIDGKSLLQKYEPFEQEGKIRHKSTSIYTGWSPLDMDEYAPVTIDLIEQTTGQVIVELHWDQLNEIIREDSD